MTYGLKPVPFKPVSRTNACFLLFNIRGIPPFAKNAKDGAPAVLSRRRTLVRRCHSRRRKSLFRLLDQFDIETERLQLTNEHVEGFWDTRLDGRLTLDDGLVDLGTAIDVIRLGSQQLLQDVGRTVCFERSHFHLTETLPTELRLATQR